MEPLQRVGIYGLGLIGGSLGLALRGRAGVARVLAFDRAQVIASPAAARAADELYDVADAERVAAACEGCDLVIVATPISVIQRVLPGLLDRAPVVLDCGSTKRAVAAAVAAHPRRGRFVPGHPMAGLPQGGLAQARADLFEGRRFLLCPEHSDGEALELVEGLVAALGSSVVKLSAAEHDRAVARTSHLPQLLASALAVVAGAAQAEHTAGPAFASATRVAGGPYSIWQDIFATNADEIAAALEELWGELGRVQGDLASSPAVLDSARELLARARQLRST